MTGERDRSASSSPRGISRRAFLKLATVTGLLAGCRPLQRPATAAPTATPTSLPIPTPTSTPAPTPTRAPTATPTTVPTPTPNITVRRPDAIRMHPQVPSKVVHAHHAGVWDGDALVPGAIRRMLDASIAELTGLNDAREAWAALFAPDERIAIKVNAFRNSLIWTHAPLVMAVTECLQEAGVPAEQIVIFDYYTWELEDARYPVNHGGPGVRCYGTDESYAGGWRVVRANIGLSDVLLRCHAVINMPVLKWHAFSGISFAMKNHYGTIDSPQRLHPQPPSYERMNRGIAELNALPPIKDRTRLIVGDVLTASLTGTWRSDWIGDSILMSFDPVAHDTVGLQIFGELLADDGGNPQAAVNRATPWLANGAELGLGTNDPEHIELVEVTL